MKILAINCGSSSLKYQLYDWNAKQLLAKGIVERIGLVGSFISHSISTQTHKLEVSSKNHVEAIEEVFKFLLDSEFGVIKSLSEIDAVGHRIVHGGEIFQKSIKIDEDFMERIKSLSELAPLHNPPNIAGVEALQRALPDILQVAVFDTAFHHTIPEYAYMYAISRKWYEKFSIRRYGFHGTSHLYVSRRAAKMIKKDINECNFISLHIGNGVSITAIKNGKSVDTSMGFTPLEGAIMGTRSGDIDPAVPLFMQNVAGLSADEVNNILNRRSGILGITGKYTDRRDVIAMAKEGDKDCMLATQMEVYRLKKYIGMYYAVLGRVDAVIFTAGAGENSPEMREKIIENMEFMGLKINKEINHKTYSKSGEAIISEVSSPTKILMIPTNEEIVFIEDVVAIKEGTYTSPDEFEYSFSK